MSAATTAPNKEELQAAWRALAAKSGRTGWQGIPISAPAPLKIQAARSSEGNQEALLVEFASEHVPASGALPVGTGFTVERAAPEYGDTTKTSLALVKTSSGHLDLFSLMVFDIVQALIEQASINDTRRLQLFLQRIHSWQSFMRQRHQGLSPEAELGLMGELKCLQALIKAGVQPYTAVDCWKGPLKGLQDFVFSTGAVEVKSTLAVHGFPAMINSLQQLDDQPPSTLFLCALRFALDPNGSTLPEIVEQLRTELRTHASSSNLINQRLLYAGYLGDHRDQYVRRFTVSTIVYFQVHDAFPRLTPENVPVGVTDARYDIDLEVLGDNHVSVDKVLYMTGAR